MGWPERRSGTRAAMLVAVAVFAAVASLLAAVAAVPPASARSSDHGASFAVRCDFSHRNLDDPIRYPGIEGNLDDPDHDFHSHDFFGNETTKFDSTYESLRAADTTCTRPKDTAAYWLPTVSWDGEVLNSNRAVFYYRAGGKDYKEVKPFPAKLKIIAGNEKRVTWRCGRTDNGGGSHRPPSRCDGPNPQLGVRIIFPDCLDVARNGKPRLNSPDHRSHMVYSRLIDGRVRCPRSYPRPVPVLTMNVTFDLPKPSGKVTLSSGGASTMHADFFNAWDQVELNHLVVSCINKVPPSKPRPDACQAGFPPPPPPPS
jgi:hypothetical protein